MSKWRERRKSRKRKAEAAPTPVAVAPVATPLGARVPTVRTLRVFDPDSGGPLQNGLILLGNAGRFDASWAYATDASGLLLDIGTEPARRVYFLEGAHQGELLSRVLGTPAGNSFLLHVEPLEPEQAAAQRAAEVVAQGVLESRCSIIEAGTPLPLEGAALALRPVVVTALPHDCQLEGLREQLVQHKLERGRASKALVPSYRQQHWAQLVLSGFAAAAVGYDPKKQWKSLHFPYALLDGPDRTAPSGAPKGPGRTLKGVWGELKKADRKNEASCGALVEALRAPETLRCLLSHREGEELVGLAGRLGPLSLSAAGAEWFANDILPALRSAFVPGAGEAPKAVTSEDLEDLPEAAEAWTLLLGSLGEDGPRLAERLCYAFAGQLAAVPDVWTELAERWWGVKVQAPVDAAMTTRAWLDEGLKAVGQLKKLGRVGWGEARPADLADIQRRLSSRLAEDLGPVRQIFKVISGSTAKVEALFERVRGLTVLRFLASAMELPTTWPVARRLPGLQRMGMGLCLSVVCRRARGFLASVDKLLGLPDAGRGPLHSVDASVDAVEGKLGDVLNLDVLELGRALVVPTASYLGELLAWVHWAEAALFCPNEELLQQTPWTGGGEREAFAHALEIM